MSEAPAVAPAASLATYPARLIESSVSEFAKVLPPSLPPEKFARWGLSVLRNGLSPGTTDQQRKTMAAWQRVLAPDNEAGRLSVMSALMDCASLGLEPGRTYHLVPYAGIVTGITDYKGEVQLIANARKDTHVIAVLVREGDRFEYQGAAREPLHEIDPFSGKPAGPVQGGYAYTMTRGQVSSLVLAMGDAEFGKHQDKGGPAWGAWPEAMRLKTLVHQLRKFVPWSAERLWAE